MMGCPGPRGIPTEPIEFQSHTEMPYLLGLELTPDVSLGSGQSERSFPRWGRNEQTHSHPWMFALGRARWNPSSARWARWVMRHPDLFFLLPALGNYFFLGLPPPPPANIFSPSSCSLPCPLTIASFSFCLSPWQYILLPPASGTQKSTWSFGFPSPSTRKMNQNADSYKRERIMAPPRNHPTRIYNVRKIVLGISASRVASLPW